MTNDEISSSLSLRLSLRADGRMTKEIRSPNVEDSLATVATSLPAAAGDQDGQAFGRLLAEAVGTAFYRDTSLSGSILEISFA